LCNFIARLLQKAKVTVKAIRGPAEFKCGYRNLFYRKDPAKAFRKEGMLEK
jgi:hypothetical protein